MKTSFHVPTLRDLRRHISKNAWNGRYFSSRDSNFDVFTGQCEYASTAMSELLTETGIKERDKGTGADWSLRIRGWYSGAMSLAKEHHSCDDHAFRYGKHCHSWVEYKGVIIDATFWQFDGDPVRVYVFPLDDPRFHRDKDAEHSAFCGRKCTLCDNGKAKVIKI
jgi:hypothetical protein